jgi:two-component system response regulator MprA
VTRGDREIDLTPTEFRLLEVFMRSPETVLARDAVTLQVWGYDTGESNYLDVHVGHLREKLEASGGSRLLQTVRAFGYVLRQQ